MSDLARGEDGGGSGEDVFGAVRKKILADLGDLKKAISVCRRCPGGGCGIPGYGEPGSALFLLAGRPGPGAAEGNPWGEWRDMVLPGLREEGMGEEGVYLSTALRCPTVSVSPAELRRCSRFLAEELFTVGPGLVVVSGKLAAVALRIALGDEVPGKPKAGDVFDLYSCRFVFNLDVSRILSEKEAAKVFWRVLRSARDTAPG